MCAIVDANVVSEVFGSNLPQAGERFFDWLNRGSGLLVVGGKLLEELEKSSANFRRWGQEAQLAGRIRVLNKTIVDELTAQVQSEDAIKSDDPHVIAVAQVSGARLLYTNDLDLQRDFKNKRLIDEPRGKVYSTSGAGNYQRRHDRLLKNRELCRR